MFENDNHPDDLKKEGVQMENDPSSRMQQEPEVNYPTGPNGETIYCQPGPNGQPIYYYMGPDGQPVFWQPKAVQKAADYQQRSYQQQSTYMESKAPKKKKRKFILFAVELLILIILAVGLFVASKLSRIERVEIKEEEIKEEVSQQLATQTVEKLQGYWNIAMFGVDSRDTRTEGQSDTIIVCSINKDTKQVKLASVYRDTYLENDGTYSKATDVYAAYGVERSIRMLNKNLDLDISDFATVNMDIVAHVVNAVGGIVIDVREDEIVHLNNYQVEGSEITGLEIVPVEAPGEQLLNGLQALSYCRIRYTDPIDEEHPGLDYERTIRQRRVLNKILEKVKTMDLISISNVVTEILPDVSTSLSQTEILSLAKDVASYELVDTVGFPFNKSTGEISAGDCVIPVNLAANVVELHRFLFDDENYEVSATVQEISNNISYNTGVY